MDFSWMGEAVKVVFAAIFGIVAKVVYDRHYAKKPDLRYSFGAPATFGMGERERVYQNLEISNAGTETTTDVRINFSLPGFDLLEHQVAYDGLHNLERTQDKATVVVPSLPPSDSLTLSFVLSPAKTSNKIRDIFLSARSKECLAKPLDRAKGPNYDWSVFSLGIVLGLSAILFYYVQGQQSKVREQFNGQLNFAEKLQLQKTQHEVARLTVQVANPAKLGKEVQIECYIENLSKHPFTGVLVIYPPTGWGRQASASNINIGSESRKVFNLTIQVPDTTQPGKYLISGELTGAAFDEPARVLTKGVLEVGP